MKITISFLLQQVCKVLELALEPKAFAIVDYIAKLFEKAGF
mgnify:CR=1 FL=1